MQENPGLIKPNIVGEHCVIGRNVTFGENVTIRHNCIIEDGVHLGSNVYIDSNTIIRSGTTLGNGTMVGANCIIGEYLMDFCVDRKHHDHPLSIGENSLIRSGSIIYGDSQIGDHFQTGHQVTIREKAQIGNHVSIGTLSDIQGECKIGDYVRLHSNVFVASLSRIDSFVWILPHVILTNDPTPPSEHFVGAHINSFAIIAAGAIIIPGVEIGSDSLVGAGAVVTKSLEAYKLAIGNPAKAVKDVRDLKNKITGEPAYPWREHFKRAMPWSESDFTTWYGNLSIDEKNSMNCSSEREED